MSVAVSAMDDGSFIARFDCANGGMKADLGAVLAAVRRQDVDQGAP